MGSFSLKLTGRSGCILEIISDENSQFVRKYSRDREYNSRLLTQAGKQRNFKIFNMFYAPAVIKIDDKDNIAWFDMEYVPGETFSEYFLHCTVSELRNGIENFLTFIDYELENSEPVLIAEEVFLSKLESIRKLLIGTINIEPGVEKIINFLLAEVPGEKLPVGKCHGDLTLSNVLFSNQKMFLIDFLDSFIETPLIDIVKLRQDTKFFWSLMIENGIQVYQRNKIIQVLRYFDQALNEHFKTNQFYLAWYNYLEKLNLLRILPYLTDRREIDFVINALI